MDGSEVVRGHGKLCAGAERSTLEYGLGSSNVCGADGIFLILFLIPIGTSTCKASMQEKKSQFEKLHHHHHHHQQHHHSPSSSLSSGLNSNPCSAAKLQGSGGVNP